MTTFADGSRDAIVVANGLLTVRELDARMSRSSWNLGERPPVRGAS
jgi:hypothetical protein